MRISDWSSDVCSSDLSYSEYCHRTHNFPNANADHPLIPAPAAARREPNKLPFRDAKSRAHGRAASATSAARSPPPRRQAPGSPRQASPAQPHRELSQETQPPPTSRKPTQDNRQNHKEDT